MHDNPSLERLTQEEMQARIDYEAAQAWIKRNAYAWGRICGKARLYAALGKHFSMRGLFEWGRMSVSVDEDRAQFKYPNALTPSFARILIQQYPECGPYITLRKSRADRVISGDIRKD